MGHHPDPPSREFLDPDHRTDPPLKPDLNQPHPSHDLQQGPLPQLVCHAEEIAGVWGDLLGMWDFCGCLAQR